MSDETPEPEAVQDPIDAALDKILVDEEPAETPSEAPEEESPEPEPEEQDAPEPQAEAEPEPISEEEYSKAYQAMLRDGWKKKDLDKLQDELGEDGLLRIGLHRLKVQGDTDAIVDERNRLRSGAKESASHETNGESSEGTPSELAVPPTLNLKEVAAPLAEQLGLDDEGSKLLVASLEKVSTAQDSHIKALNENLGMVSNALHDLMLDGAKKDSGLDQSLDEASWPKVKERYAELAKTSLHSELEGFTRMRALLRSAARLEIPDLPSDSEIQRQASIADAKRTGTVTVPRKKATPKPKTEDEKQDMVLKAILNEKVETPEEAAAYARRLS